MLAFLLDHQGEKQSLWVTDVCALCNLSRVTDENNIFSVKDSEGFCSRVIYKFTCACCNACYIGETGRHFSTRVREHLSSDKSSHIFKHLQSSERCRQSCSADCFEILDSAPTKFQLKLKEAMHINWEKPNLNQQVHHVNLTLTL